MAIQTEKLGYGARFRRPGIVTGHWAGGLTLNVSRNNDGTGWREVCCHTWGGESAPTRAAMRGLFDRITGQGADACEVCSGVRDAYGISRPFTRVASALDRGDYVITVKGSTPGTYTVRGDDGTTRTVLGYVRKRTKSPFNPGTFDRSKPWTADDWGGTTLGDFRTKDDAVRAVVDYAAGSAS